MPIYVIEREIPGAAGLTADQLKDIACKSNQVAAGLGVPYKWITSYAAGDKVYCVHEAESEDVIRRHSREAGFPVNKVSQVGSEFGPQTAGGK